MEKGEGRRGSGKGLLRVVEQFLFAVSVLPTSGGSLGGDLSATIAREDEGSLGTAFEPAVATEDFGDVGGDFLADEFEPVAGSKIGRAHV